MYADDTNVTFSAAAIPGLESQINSDLKYIDLQSLNDYTMNIHIDDRRKMSDWSSHDHWQCQIQNGGNTSIVCLFQWKEG